MVYKGFGDKIDVIFEAKEINYQRENAKIKIFKKLFLVISWTIPAD